MSVRPTGHQLDGCRGNDCRLCRGIPACVRPVHAVLLHLLLHRQLSARLRTGESEHDHQHRLLVAKHRARRATDCSIGAGALGGCRCFVRVDVYRSRVVTGAVCAQEVTTCLLERLDRHAPDAGHCGEWLLGVLCQHRRFVVCRRRQHCTIASRRLYRCGCRRHCGICGEPYRHGHPQYDRCPATRHQLLFRCRTIAANETHPAGGDECRSHIVAPVDALPAVWRTPAAAVLHQGRRRGSLCTQHPCYATLCIQLSRVVD